MPAPNANQVLSTPTESTGEDEARVYDVTAELFIANRGTTPEQYANNSFFALTRFVTTHATEVSAQLLVLEDMPVVRCQPSLLAAEIADLRIYRHYTKPPLYVTLLDRIVPSETVALAPVVELGTGFTLRAGDFTKHKELGGIASFHQLMKRVVRDPELADIVDIREQAISPHDSEFVVSGDLRGLLDHLSTGGVRQPRYVSLLRTILREKQQAQVQTERSK